jgi:hypothetical protein
MAGHWKINPQVMGLARLGAFDPFSGHGLTPLYCARHRIRYVGFDTNARAREEYLHLVVDEVRNTPGADVDVWLHDSTVFVPDLEGRFDLCYTSPPYFNFEEYGGNRAHYHGCQSYDDFHSKITVPVFRNVWRYLVPGSTLALQTEKDARARKRWLEVIESLGYLPVTATTTGGPKHANYSTHAKRDQTLLMFTRP